MRIISIVGSVLAIVGMILFTDTASERCVSHNTCSTSHAAKGGNAKKFAKTMKAIAGERAWVARLISIEAPRYGVPAWFAQRIAKIESG